jgi:predicted nucleic acid-binding protein
MEGLLAGRWGPILLPEYVFLEVTTVLRARCGHQVAVDVGTQLLEAKEVEFVACSEYCLEAFKIFAEKKEVALSLADAAIVAICRRRSATSIATFDEDFRKIPSLEVAG